MNAQVIYQPGADPGLDGLLARVRDMPPDRLEMLMFVGSALISGILQAAELERMTVSADPYGTMQAWRRRLTARQRAAMAWRRAYVHNLPWR